MANHQGKSEVIVYKDIAFRRYPQSNKWADRNYYVPNASHRKRGMGRLHQEIWKDAYGDIPDGYHIHHKDENPLNNALENLECLSIADHNSYHVATYTEEELEQRRERFKRVRQAAINWHKSEEGKAWHGELAQMAWSQAKYATYTCKDCGKDFQSRAVDTNSPQFCSNNCKSHYRYKSGVDNEQRLCASCRQAFTINRYSPVKCCSRKCAQQLRRNL